MGTEIARMEQGSSALVTREYLTEKAALVRELYAPGTSDLEFEHFVEVCATRGLNPLAKQIYCVMRWDGKQKREVPTIQTSIDGYRLIAQRTGQYRGQVGPQWCGADGVWREVWLETQPPAAARVGVIREGFAEPLYGVARWSSYVQTTKDGNPAKFWAQMPDVMLAKVAESLALRKAFPEELSGLYTTEEMGQAAAAPSPEGETKATIRRRWQTLRGFGLPDEAIVARLRDLDPPIESSAALIDDSEFDRAIDAMQAAVDAAEPDEPIEGEVVSDSDEALADALWEDTKGAHRDPTA